MCWVLVHMWKEGRKVGNLFVVGPFNLDVCLVGVGGRSLPLNLFTIQG